MTDAVKVLAWLYLSASAPPAPGPTTCGADTTPSPGITHPLRLQRPGRARLPVAKVYRPIAADEESRPTRTCRMNRPELIVSVFVLAGACANATLGADDPNRIYLEDRTVTGWTKGVALPVLFDTDQPRHSISLALKYDPAMLDVKAVSLAGSAGEGADWTFQSIDPIPRGGCSWPW